MRSKFATWRSTATVTLMGIFLATVCAASQVRAETISVESQSEGTSRANAISAALVAALEQASGVQIEAQSSLRQELASAANGEARSVSLSENQQVAVRRQTGGVIKNYDVVSVEPSGNGYTAVLKVNIERYSAPGLPTQDRRRIVIAPPVNLAGLQPTEVVALRDALETFLTQTRRFAVLDRQNEATYRTEMELLRGPDVPISETVRIGQVIGADYVLRTKVRKIETVTQEQVLPITGEKVVRRSTQAVADFMILEIASRQVKWAGQVAHESSADRATELGLLAKELGGKVVSGIYPLRVVQVLAPNSVVVNQGGDTIKVGQTFSANRLGEMAVDPYTKEPLGPVEIPVGTVRISRVDPKLSYGDLISGSLPTEFADLILRPLLSVPTGGSAAPAVDANQGIRPKW